MMRKLMTMRDCLADPNYLGGEGMLGGDSWRSWRIVLIAAMGEALTEDERVTFTELTGREREPGVPVEELWGVVGRRGGKSRAIAALGAYLACCVDHRPILAPGQFGLVPIIAASKEQAGEILSYAKGIFSEAPGFVRLLEGPPTADTITLASRVEIQVRAAHFRRTRGFTAVAAVGDEACFWTSETSTNPDKEILDALRPSLATTGGPLIVISSPYAKRGEVYAAFRRHFGAEGDPLILVVKAPSKAMNPSLSDRVIERAYEADPVVAATEYGAEFRAGIDAFMSEEIIDPCVMRGTFEIAPSPGTRYVGFVDAASGSGADSMTMAVAFKDGDHAVLACLVERRPRFDPEQVTEEFSGILKRYGITRVRGDRWAAGFVEAAFKRHGISYEASELTKSDLYRELTPRLNAGQVRLLDNRRMLVQLLQLERRTARGGKDSIDHPPGGHDDAINAACGALVSVATASQSLIITPEAMAWASRRKPNSHSRY